LRATGTVQILIWFKFFWLYIGCHGSWCTAYTLSYGMWEKKVGGMDNIANNYYLWGLYVRYLIKLPLRYLICKVPVPFNDVDLLICYKVLRFEESLCGQDTRISSFLDRCVVLLSAFFRSSLCTLFTHSYLYIAFFLYSEHYCCHNL